METEIKNTGYTSTLAIFDTTAIESPFYETSSIRGTLIEGMKNNTLIVDKPVYIEKEVLKIKENETVE